MLELFMNSDWCYPEWSMGCPIDSNVKYEICRIVSCHSIPKRISDEEDILKFFMDFDITPHGPVLRMVVRSQIVTQQLIPPSQ